MSLVLIVTGVGMFLTSMLADNAYANYARKRTSTETRNPVKVTLLDQHTVTIGTFLIAVLIVGALLGFIGFTMFFLPRVML